MKQPAKSPKRRSKSTISSARSVVSAKSRKGKGVVEGLNMFQENWVNIPNLLSVSRVLMVGPFIYFAHIQDTQQNAIIPLIAIILLLGLTDFMDGLIARKFRLVTTLGAYLDPIADKFVITVSLITMAFYFDFPIWILVLYLLRELITVYLATILWKKKVPSVPNIWGKWAVALMIFLLPVYLLRYSLMDHYPVLRWVAEILAYAWFTCYFLSGIRYWQRYGNTLVHRTRLRKHAKSKSKK